MLKIKEIINILGDYQIINNEFYWFEEIMINVKPKSVESDDLQRISLVSKDCLSPNTLALNKIFSMFRIDNEIVREQLINILKNNENDIFEETQITINGFKIYTGNTKSNYKCVIFKVVN